MTTLTLIYAANSAGGFTDETGKCWDADRAFFRETIKGKSIICGRKTFEQDYKGLAGAQMITVLTNLSHEDFSKKYPKIIIELARNRTLLSLAHTVLDALQNAKMTSRFGGDDNPDEIFCIGGKQTIEAFAPFASRMLVTTVGSGEIWMPPFIERERDMAFNDDELWMHCESKATHYFDGEWGRYDYRRFQRIEF